MHSDFSLNTYNTYLSKIVCKEKVRALVPGKDYEMLYFSIKIDVFGQSSQVGGIERYLRHPAIKSSQNWVTSTPVQLP